MSLVVDASAVLALYFGEPGFSRVEESMPGALLSSVNYTEVIGKCLDRGEAFDATLRNLAAIGMEVVAFDLALARRAGALRPVTKQFGLSLADRACLALAEREKAAVLTADRNWSLLDLGLDIRLIR